MSFCHSPDTISERKMLDRLKKDVNVQLAMDFKGGTGQNVVNN